MTPIKEAPPERRRGKGGGPGRPHGAELLDAMRVVANDTGEWFRIARFDNRGSASSAANRYRQTDWDAILGLRNGRSRYRWDVVARSSEDPTEGSAVYARRVKVSGR